MAGSKYGKWIGGGLGWAVGGPIGALFGFFLGSVFDDISKSESSAKQISGNHSTGRGDFALSLIALSAAVMKADGKVLKSELAFVKSFLNNNFGKKASTELLLVLRQTLNKDIDVRSICMQIGRHMDASSRLQLLHYLFGISKSDDHVSASEVSLIENISSWLGINKSDFDSIKAMFYEDTDTAYKILEISPNSSDEEVKTAYRKMAKKYHPDRVGHLGSEVQKAATEKFHKVDEAYDAIRKERGIR